MRVPYIRTRTSPSHSRAFSLSIQRSLSLVSGRSLSSAVALSLAVALASLSSRGTSLARRATRLASRILSSVSSQSRVSPTSEVSNFRIFKTHFDCLSQMPNRSTNNESSNSEVLELYCENCKVTILLAEFSYYGKNAKVRVLKIFRYYCI